LPWSQLLRSVFLRLRQRDGRLEVAGPIHLWPRLARDQPSPGFGSAGTRATAAVEAAVSAATIWISAGDQPSPGELCAAPTGQRWFAPDSEESRRSHPPEFATTNYALTHPRAQQDAFRRRDARQQSRSFARWNQSLRRSPNFNRLYSEG
jgi:hypothetical protein